MGAHIFVFKYICVEQQKGNMPFNVSQDDVNVASTSSIFILSTLKKKLGCFSLLKSRNWLLKLLISTPFCWRNISSSLGSPVYILITPMACITYCALVTMTCSIWNWALSWAGGSHLTPNPLYLSHSLCSFLRFLAQLKCCENRLMGWIGDKYTPWSLEHSFFDFVLINLILISNHCLRWSPWILYDCSHLLHSIFVQVRVKVILKGSKV